MISYSTKKAITISLFALLALIFTAPAMARDSYYDEDWTVPIDASGFFNGNPNEDFYMALQFSDAGRVKGTLTNPNNGIKMTITGKITYNNYDNRAKLTLTFKHPTGSYTGTYTNSLSNPFVFRGTYGKKKPVSMTFMLDVF